MFCCICICAEKRGKDNEFVANCKEKLNKCVEALGFNACFCYWIDFYFWPGKVHELSFLLFENDGRNDEMGDFCDF